MATKYYLHATAALATPVYTPATIRGAWDQTAGAIARRMEQTKEGGGVIANLGIAETNATLDFDVLLARYISGPLAAQTINGTIDACIALSSSSAAANLHWHLHIYVTQGDTDTPRGTLLSDYTEAAGTNEWPTSNTFWTLNAAATLSSLAISAGDRVVIEVGYVSREASATSRTGTVWLGTSTSNLGPAADGVAGATNFTTGAGFFTFSGTIAEDATLVAIRGSQVALEVIDQAPTAEARFSQFALEVISLSAPDPAGGWSHQVIEYAGDGVSGREIATTVPLNTGNVAVWILPVLPAGVGTAPPPVLRTSADSDSWLDGSSGAVANYITGFTASGFTLGPGDGFGHVNNSGVKYIAIVCRDNTPAKDFMRVAHYTGNATDNRTIVVDAAGFQPTHVWVAGGSFVYRSTDFTGDSSVTLRAQAAGSNMIQAFVATGFEIGTSGNVNTNSSIYSYVAIRATSAFLASGFASFKLTGTSGVDSVSGFGFAPGFVLAKQYAAGEGAYYKSTIFPNNPSDGGDDSQNWAGSNDTGAAIISLNVDGATFGEVVAPNGADVYGYAWRSGSITSSSLQKVTQLALLVAEDEDADADPPPADGSCTGGGTVASGTNPGAETSLATATTPLIWMKVTPTVGTAVEWSKVGIPYGTMKHARVKMFGRARRALTDGDGAPEASRVTSTLFDTDGVVRALAATGFFEGALVEYFAADLVTLQASGTPSRRFRGYVMRHRAVENLEYEIEVLDALSARLTSIDQDDLQTPQTLVDNAISDQNPTERMFDKPIPESYGSIADADTDDPVWECKHVGNITVPGFESLGNMPAFLVCLGVQGQITRIDGADLSSGDPPTARARLPESARTGADPYIYVPTMAGYFDVNPWYLQSGRRYTLIFGKDGHPVIMHAVQGRIPLAINFCGYETVGDSSGNTIDKPARALLHWLNNRVAQDAVTNWLSIASFGDYSLFDTTSFATVATYQATLGVGGLLIGGLVGADYQQRSWRDRIEEWCRNFGFSYGINRHGQGMLAMLDRTNAASSAPAFTPSNIIDGSLSSDLRKDAVEDEVQYVFAPEHLTTLPELTPTPGSRLFRDPYDGKWRSGLRSFGSGVKPSHVQEYNLVRQEDTAVAVATERYALRSLAGGRAEPTFTVWFRDGCDLELGQVITATHPDLPWTGVKRCWIRALEEDFDEFVITQHVQNVHDLLP